MSKRSNFIACSIATRSQTHHTKIMLVVLQIEVYILVV